MSDKHKGMVNEHGRSVRREKMVPVAPENQQGKSPGSGAGNRQSGAGSGSGSGSMGGSEAGSRGGSGTQTGGMSARQRGERMQTQAGRLRCLSDTHCLSSGLKG